MRGLAGLVLGALLLVLPAYAANGVDLIIIEKAARRLVLMEDGHEIARYRIRLGQHPVGPKARQGDSRTPEGRYVIDRRNARSSYYRSLGISYPNAEDRTRARKLGVSPGGDIFIHGLPNGYDDFYLIHLMYDWTDGCIAVNDTIMDQLWPLVPVGTPVEIRP